MSDFREEKVGIDSPQKPICTLSYNCLIWFKRKRPNLMPHGGWERLKQLENNRELKPVAKHWVDN